MTHKFLAQIAGWVSVTVTKRENKWTDGDDRYQIISDML